MLQRKRINGFSGRMTRDQITAVVTLLVLTALYYILVGTTLRGDKLTIAMAVHVPLVVLLIAAWLYVEIVDPALEGGIPCICLRESQNSARYCGACRKTVIGLDHHCSWLNTCIGKRNYAQFYCLITSAFWLMCIQVAVGVLLVTAWNMGEVRDNAEKTFGHVATYHGLAVVLVVLSGLQGIGLGSLYGFHTFLVFVAGKGTYDWLIDRRKGPQTAQAAGPTPEETKQQADIEARREQERQEWLQQREKKKQQQQQASQDPGVEMTPRATAELNNTNDNAV